jgi:hypothetical protein
VAGARDVAALSARAGDEANLHWIAGGGEDNGDRRGRRLRRQISRRIGDNHSHLTTNQLSPSSAAPARIAPLPSDIRSSRLIAGSRLLRAPTVLLRDWCATEGSRPRALLRQ